MNDLIDPIEELKSINDLMRLLSKRKKHVLMGLVNKIESFEDRIKFLYTHGSGCLDATHYYKDHRFCTLREAYDAVKKIVG